VRTFNGFGSDPTRYRLDKRLGRIILTEQP